MFVCFKIESVQPSLTNLLVGMERVPMWKGVCGSEPIIILEQNRVLHNIRKSPKLPDTSGEMLWCLSQRQSTKYQL